MLQYKHNFNDGGADVNTNAVHIVKFNTLNYFEEHSYYLETEVINSFIHIAGQIKIDISIKLEYTEKITIYR